MKTDNKNETEDFVLTRDNVLGMDIATHTGYYSTHESGCWDFSESMRRNNNKQHKAFRDTLIDFIQKYDIKQIVAEDVNCGRMNKEFVSSRKLSEFRGILMEICDTMDLPEPVFINLRTVKKWATGDGNADKEKMVRFCRSRWKTNPADDNEADATHIFMYYIKKFKL
jgi:Holliday junction resolvasome RuvABC endonuclease subunit